MVSSNPRGSMEPPVGSMVRRAVLPRAFRNTIPPLLPRFVIVVRDASSAWALLKESEAFAILRGNSIKG